MLLDALALLSWHILRPGLIGAIRQQVPQLGINVIGQQTRATSGNDQTRFWHYAFLIKVLYPINSLGTMKFTQPNGNSIFTGKSGINAQVPATLWQ